MNTETACLLALDLALTDADKAEQFEFASGAIRECGSSTILSVDFGDDDVSF